MNQNQKLADNQLPLLPECDSFDDGEEQGGQRNSFCPSFNTSDKQERKKCRNVSFEIAAIDEVKRKVMEGENKAASIDFKEMFKEYRARTEMSAPHIHIQVEDTMFIHDTKLVSIECIYYAKDTAEQGRLKNLCLKDSQSSLLPTMKKDKKDKVYSQKPLCFQESAENYLDENKNLQEASSNSMIELLISTWDINMNGQLMKDKEVSFKCQSEFNSHRKFKLQLSNDSKYIMLPLLSTVMIPGQSQKGTKYQKIELLLWEANTLAEKKFPLIEAHLCKLPHADLIGNFDQIMLAGRNEYLVIKFKSKKRQNNFILQTQTGEVKQMSFDFNTPISMIVKRNNSSLKPQTNTQDKKLKFLDPNENYYMMDFVIDETDTWEQEVLSAEVTDQKETANK